MVECTALEMRHTGNRIGGSNPSLSASWLYPHIPASTIPLKIKQKSLLWHPRLPPDVAGYTHTRGGYHGSGGRYGEAHAAAVVSRSPEHQTRLASGAMAIRPPALSPSSVIGWGHSGVAAIAASVHADVEIERAIMALQQVPWHMIIAIIVPSPIKSEAGTSRRRARLGARLRTTLFGSRRSGASRPYPPGLHRRKVVG